MVDTRRSLPAKSVFLAPRENNVLKNAPHTAKVIAADKWERLYSREHAAFPTSATWRNKFFPYVGRVNNVLGDRKLICAYPPVEEYAESV